MRGRWYNTMNSDKEDDDGRRWRGEGRGTRSSEEEGTYLSIFIRTM